MTPTQQAALATGAELAPRRSELRLGLQDAAYADAVLADLNRIRGTKSGRQLFRALDAAGCSVSVVKPDPPTDPPNAWTLQPDPGAPIVVVYDPADWPGPDELGGLPSDIILFGRLQHALTIATGQHNATDAEEAVSPAMAAYLRERTPAEEA